MTGRSRTAVASGFASGKRPNGAVMYRSKKLLALAQFAPCMHCGIEDGTIVAAHSNQLRDGKGRGLKSHDYRISL